MNETTYLTVIFTHHVGFLQHKILVTEKGNY